jgi:hypothetical protein
LQQDHGYKEGCKKKEPDIELRPQGYQIHRPRGGPAVAYSGFAIGADRSERASRGFLPRKTTPRDLYEAKVIAKIALSPTKKGVKGFIHIGKEAA